MHELVTSYDAVARVSVEPLWVGEEASLKWFTVGVWVTLVVVSVLAGSLGGLPALGGKSR